MPECGFNRCLQPVLSYRRALADVCFHMRGLIWLEAIASRLEAIASKLEAIAIT